MMRSRNQPAARMAAMARNSIDAAIGAGRCAVADQLDDLVRQVVEVGLVTRRRCLLRTGTLGHQRADHRRDVAERPILQHVAVTR